MKNTKTFNKKALFQLITEVKGVFYHINFGSFRSTHERRLKNVTQTCFPYYSGFT